MNEYKLIRSRRRTVALQVRRDGTLMVRAPHFVRDSEIRRYVEAKRLWIEKTIARFRVQQTLYPKVQLEKSERIKHHEDVFMKLTLRCQYYAQRMKVSYQRIRLSNARARWGSCSQDGRLCFNWRLALVPEEILDYVVVHELAHLLEANHSSRFWEVVEKFYPNASQAKVWLKDNQSRLTAIH